MDCPFCNQENYNKQKIYETENEIVLYNLSPRTKGQCLVIPKRHVVGVRELSEEEAMSLMRTVKFVSEKLNAYL
jgi:histidine triad (HIT) family protein